MHVRTFPVITSDIISTVIEEGSTLQKSLEVLKDLIDMAGDEARQHQSSVIMTLLMNAVSFEYMTDSLVINALDIIRTRYKDKLTNEILARSFDYNTNYFIRRFTQAVGITPGLYLANYRLSMAIRLIISGMSITDVAYQVGYDDAKAFSRFFKKQTGVSPPSKYNDYYLMNI